MTRYWIKIVLGALLIFVIGMAGWVGLRKGVSTVHTVFETADPISIPLKFITFRVDGAPLGKIERLRLFRSAPKAIASVEVTVRVDSAAAVDRLRSCVMRLDDVEHIDEHTSFVCVTGVPSDSTGTFEAFGQVLIEGTDVVLPLLLPAGAVSDLRHQGWEGADSMAPPAPEAPPAVPKLPAPKVTVSVP